MARLLSRSRRRLAAEEGIGIVEVMVSAMLLIIVGVAVLDGIDTATGISGQARARAIAANVAQQDQERLRTLKAQQLSNLFDVNTRDVSGIPMTTTSRGDWVSDATQTTSCESGSASNDYIKLTTTTTWPGATDPVELESIMAPPNGSFGPTQGSVAVQVDNRDDEGQPGIEVDIVGPPSFDKDTDELGCAFFGFLPAGNQYRAVLDTPGFVDPNGNQRVEPAVSIQAEGLTAQSFKYDRAATLTANFTTKVAGVVRPARTNSLILQNAGLPEGSRVLSFTDRSTHTAGSLFPFPAPYVVFAGRCVSAKPPDALRPDHSASLDPGGQETLDVRMPALNVRVLNSSGAPAPNATVKFTQTGSGCGSSTKVTNSSGLLDSPEMPYGTFTVCTAAPSSSHVKTTLANNNPEGTDLTLDQRVSPQSGACP